MAGWCPAISGKSQMEDLPLTLAGHDLWRFLSTRVVKMVLPWGSAPHLHSPSTRSFSIELIPTTSTCAARGPDTSYLID